ncbi:MAG: hypothetical protein FWF18_01250 [Dehalococcoidia bacterium]|nr:hypothetical protein [Dehalococcoidia bacterium]
MLFTLPLGCVLSNAPIDTDTARGAEGAVPTNKETGEDDLAMSEDFLDGFYIIYEFGYSLGKLKPELDTKNNIIGKNTYYDGHYSIDYTVPKDKLQEIYDLIIQYDIKSYSSPELIAREDGVTVTPNRYHRITFCLNGEIYSVFCDASVLSMSHFNPPFALPEKYHHLTIFYSKFARVYVYDTDEYKAFPDAWIPY